jgi:hypothetical protein
MSLILDGTNGLSDVDGSAATPAIRGSDANTGIFFPAADTIAFAEGGAEAMRIDSDGDVGIGTTTPGKKLDILSNTSQDGIRISGSSNPRLTIIDTTTPVQFDALCTDTEAVLRTDTNHPLVFSTNGTERARITSSGALIVPYIYNTTSGSAANVIVGSDGNLFRSTSALKYKTDVRDLESIDIDLFRPVRYKSKSEIDDPTKDHIGIIADEVDVIGIKELVTYGSNGEVEGFQYERLTVVLLKAIQELKAELDTVKAELATLKGAQA